jgi:hypothetical protein
MLFREAVAVYCENRTKRTNALCERNAEFLCVTAGGTYSDLGCKRLLDPVGGTNVRENSEIVSWPKGTSAGELP